MGQQQKWKQMWVHNTGIQSMWEPKPIIILQTPQKSNLLCLSVLGMQNATSVVISF